MYSKGKQIKAIVKMLALLFLRRNKHMPMYRSKVRKSKKDNQRGKRFESAIKSGLSMGMDVAEYQQSKKATEYQNEIETLQNELQIETANKPMRGQTGSDFIT